MKKLITELGKKIINQPGVASTTGFFSVFAGVAWLAKDKLSPTSIAQTQPNNGVTYPPIINFGRR